MIVLGIDPGIALTGWAVLKKSGTKAEMIEYGCIKTKAGRPKDQRFLKLFEELQEIIKKYQPKALSLEKLFFNKNVKTNSIVAEARGVVRVCAALNKVPVSEFTPLQIKNCVAGYGRATKKQVQQMVKTLLNLDSIPKPDDAADAVATALTFCFHNPNLEA